MPRVNLLFGLAPAERLDVAADLVRRASARHLRFEVRLARFGVLERTTGATPHLVPECQPADALQRLWSACAERFPGCVTRDGFVPHLTVGRFASDARAARAQAAAYEAAWTPRSFEVRAPSLLAREGDQAPFAVQREVWLGLALERWLSDRGEVESRSSGDFLGGSAPRCDRRRRPRPQRAPSPRGWR